MGVLQSDDRRPVALLAGGMGRSRRLVMYILILTIAGSFAHNPAAISSAPGFQTEQSCMAAGNAWLQQIKKLQREGSALCVKA
jgi:hypothetical protein